jgi:hypothetical protein
VLKREVNLIVRIVRGVYTVGVGCFAELSSEGVS